MTRDPRFKPCPFCGCEDIRSDVHPDDSRYSSTGHVFSMCCYGCGIHTANCNSIEPMIAKWNARAYHQERMPPRRRDETPAQYWKRTGWVPASFTRKCRGWYFCNPAHCKGRWRSKRARDEHLDRAYAALS